MTASEPLIKDLKERWAEIGHYKTTKELKFEIEFYKKMLNIFQIGPSFFMIFNPPASKIEYASPEISSVLGYKPEEYDTQTFLRIIHPEDLPYFADFEDTVVNFKMNLPTEKLMKYKSRYDFRMKRADGEYVRMMQQSVTIQIDDDGAVLRNFVVYTDISELKHDNRMSLSFIGLEGEPSFVNVETSGKFIPGKEILTEREKEIVRMLSKNLSTKEIAEQLSISPLTVKTHRRNISQKTNTSTVLELVMKSIEKGWI